MCDIWHILLIYLLGFVFIVFPFGMAVHEALYKGYKSFILILLGTFLVIFAASNYPDSVYFRSHQYGRYDIDLYDRITQLAGLSGLIMQLTGTVKSKSAKMLEYYLYVIAGHFPISSLVSYIAISAC